MTRDDKDDIVAPTDLLPHDVVLGKMASGNFLSPGNRLFKQFLLTKKRDYSQISSHSGKKRFLAQCVEEWCSRMEGRFLFRETTILCTVVKSEADKLKLLAKVNALMRNLPSPSSSTQAAELEAGSITAASQEESHMTPKKQNTKSITERAAPSVTVSSTSSDASVSDSNESQTTESRTSPPADRSDTLKSYSLSFRTEEKILDASSDLEEKEERGSDAIISSSDSSTDTLQQNNNDRQPKQTPAAGSKKNKLRPSPTSITAFHQVQEDDEAIGDECSG